MAHRRQKQVRAKKQRGMGRQFQHEDDQLLKRARKSPRKLAKYRYEPREE